MIKVLILGANGQLAKNTTKILLNRSDVQLTLYLRNSKRLTNPDPDRATIVEGDVLDVEVLTQAMKGQDVVYANLSGSMAVQAARIIDAMHTAGVKRLIFISSMGIYGEVPGEKYRPILDPYRDAAAAIEKSNLDYTILRPGWFVRSSSTDYQLTSKGQAFIGHEVSLEALSRLITELITTPGLHIRESLGVSQGEN